MSDGRVRPLVVAGHELGDLDQELATRMGLVGGEVLQHRHEAPPDRVPRIRVPVGGNGARPPPEFAEAHGFEPVEQVRAPAPAMRIGYQFTRKVTDRRPIGTAFHDDPNDLRQPQPGRCLACVTDARRSSSRQR
ncbi:hypothetical protein [Novosphingobium mangrovi (ex Huang et al. 2023)]|uniref:Uncharacterized protein n=1 Tax=Novosphingobium mangrovi (ex Huang et al. 2023) TaxID=2976432 RepID=A0ABT2I0W7_9SPHN|nr:hypothetical protein [Novosphingobium mangrovi (ex Huang et al. 2023)]MCT2398452.1 hypothetical protein [Novosphingobium mangrovi (ex Huang et al. 2023)]